MAETPLGLRHLRDNPEHSRSTTKAQEQPTLTPPQQGQNDTLAGKTPLSWEGDTDAGQ